MNANKIHLARNLYTIIIDEASMVRCDIIDVIDRTLRNYVGNSAPFGGIQMVFVGDMFQLEPIATQKDKDTLKEIYGLRACKNISEYPLIEVTKTRKL